MKLKEKIKIRLNDKGWGKEYECYVRREMELKKLSFSSYQEYLRSGLWKLIKSQRLEKDEHKCFLCGNKANIVHHKSYCSTALSGKDLDLLITLCNDCHQKIEFNGSVKCNIKQANNRLKRLCKLKSAGLPLSLPDSTMNEHMHENIKTELREKVLSSSGGVCYLCGDIIVGNVCISKKTMSRDGGRNKLDNLIALCQPCIELKGKKSMDELLSWLPDKGSEYKEKLNKIERIILKHLPNETREYDNV